LCGQNSLAQGSPHRSLLSIPVNGNLCQPRPNAYAYFSAGKAMAGRLPARVDLRVRACAMLPRKAILAFLCTVPPTTVCLCVQLVVRVLSPIYTLNIYTHGRVTPCPNVATTKRESARAGKWGWQAYARMPA
jgi:hypothetical protein